MEKIQVNFIIEMMGKPEAHLKESLNTIVVKLGSEKGTNILSKNYHEPKKIENSEMFTSFAEVELEFDSYDYYTFALFNYLPAHVEVISPSQLTLTSHELSDYGNRLIQTMHQYDSAAKTLIIEKNKLIKKLKEVAPNLFKNETNASESEESAKKG